MLPKTLRLSGGRAFKRIFQKGDKVRTPLFLVRSFPAKRWGFAGVVSKKISAKAVVRNKINRQINEAIKIELDKGLPDKPKSVVFSLINLPKSFEDICQNIEIWRKGL